MTIKRLMCLIFIFGLVLSTTGVAKVSKKQQTRIRFSPASRNRVHDISIVQIRVEPTQFKIGDRVHVLVNVANRGEISVDNVSIELKVRGAPSGRRNIATIAPGQIVEVDFGWLISKRKSELIELAAIIESAQMEKRPKGKIKKVRYNYLYDAEGDVGILYKVDQPVHQWIAFQAYKKLPEGSLKDEIRGYLPTSSSDPYYLPGFDTSGWSNNYNSFYISLRALIEGAWEEDKPFIEGRWMAHYWNPDGGYDDGLYIGFKSALQKAQEDLWQDAISTYNSGQTAQAYYLLGRVAHLLMDMSVPAHTLLDEHGGDPVTGDDQYEEFTKDNYKNITSSSSNTGIPSGLPSYPQYTPPSYNDNLTKLFYNLAEKSDDFDSDDEDGESTDYGKGKYTLGRNALDASKTFSRAEYFVWTLLSGWEKERDLVRYVDYDIFRSCINSNEYHIYYYRSFYNEYNNTLTHWVKVYYTDGSYEFVDWDLEELGDVPDSVLECIHQKQLQARAVGYVAALYQLFWDSVEHPDTVPPTPSPMTWATEPYPTSTSSILMVATVASDPSTPIYYEFDFFTSPSGGSGGTDSGWQTSTSYTDSGLEPNHRYSYRVRAKDSATTPNVTAYSSVSYDYTDIETPSGITFGTITSTSIQVKSTNTPSGLDRGSSGLYISSSTGQNSGWKQNNDYWTCSDLTPNYDTGFRIKARNGDSDETGYCTTVYKYTLANQPGPLPFSNITTNSIQVNWTSNGNYYYTDYYCENLTTGQNSGWVNNAYSWNNTGLSDGMSYTFRVKARNSEGIETEWTHLGIAITPVAGSLQVTITPQGAVNAGAKWKLIGTGSPDENWKSSGQILPNIPVGSYTLQFKDISGFAEPLLRNIEIVQGMNTESGTYHPIYSGGTGIETDPYSISCTDDLLDMSDNPASWDKHFILTADIDLDPNGPGGQVFTTAVIAPDINNVNWDFDGSPFTGAFDGAEHKIVNLTINTNGVGNDNLGLFGCVFGGEIKDLGLENVSIIGGDDSMCLGGLVGENDVDSISNCYSTGVVISGGGGDSVCFGGLAGVNHGTLNNCYSTCAVSGGENSDNFGGLVGCNSGSISNCIATGDVTGDDDGTETLGGLVGGNSGDISNCIATGDVTGRRYSGPLGGLVGSNRGTISNCRSTGVIIGGDESGGVGGLVGSTYDGSSVINCYSTGNVTGGDGARRLGGLVGFNWGFSGTTTISNCYALGAVAGGNDSSALGGLVGDNENYGTVSNSYATGSVSGDSSVGGLVGDNTGTVSNSYSVGDVNGSSYVGGLIGYDNLGEYTKSFWANTVNPDVNGIGNGSDPNVINESTANMQTESTYTNVGWDFVGETANGTDDIWDICEGMNYPKLVWSIPVADFVCPDGVTMIDFAVFGAVWMSDPNQPNWNPIYDISDPNDNFINELDLKVFTENWLWQAVWYNQ